MRRCQSRLVALGSGLVLALGSLGACGAFTAADNGTNAIDGGTSPDAIAANADGASPDGGVVGTDAPSGPSFCTTQADAAACADFEANQRGFMLNLCTDACALDFVPGGSVSPTAGKFVAVSGLAVSYAAYQISALPTLTRVAFDVQATPVAKAASFTILEAGYHDSAGNHVFAMVVAYFSGTVLQVSMHTEQHFAGATDFNSGSLTLVNTPLDGAWHHVDLAFHNDGVSSNNSNEDFRLLTDAGGPKTGGSWLVFVGANPSEATANQGSAVLDNIVVLE
jgi:hypothetical protein